MQFDYEIPADEFAAAQVLSHIADNKHMFVKRGLFWILLGLFFEVIVVTRWDLDWAPILVLLTGAWFIGMGVSSLFPTRYFRRMYPESVFSGKVYHADLNEDGFSVSGDGCSWRVLWSEVSRKGENDLVFMFGAKGTIFIFGKKYLAAEQQKDIRRFASMP